MRYFTLFAILPLLFLAFGCKEKAASAKEAIEELLSSRPDTCYLESAADVPRINRHIDFTAEERIFLQADEQGNCRVEVYHLYSCEPKATYVLPQNEPANAPYYLANLHYNNARRQLAVRGTRSFYLLDLTQGQLSEAITPSFPETLLADASSDMIQHLEVWENYLVGALSDGDCFVYELQTDSIRAVPATATYTDPQSNLSQSLFLIPNDTGYYQAILPTLDENKGTFEVRPIFDRPMALDTSSRIHAPASPYLRFKQTDGKLVGIDLRTAALLPTIEQEVPN